MKLERKIIHSNALLLLLSLILTLNTEDINGIKINFFFLKALFITLIVTRTLFEIVDKVSIINKPYFRVKNVLALLVCLTLILMIFHNIYEPQQNEAFVKTTILIMILIFYSMTFKFN